MSIQPRHGALAPNIAPPNPSPSQHSCDVVFQLPELLESVLLCLPLKQILTVQRVSTQFKNTVKGSPNIQRALFYQSSTKPDQIWAIHDGYKFNERVWSREECRIEATPDWESALARGPGSWHARRPLVPNSMLLNFWGDRCPFWQMALEGAVLVLDVDWDRIGPQSSCLEMFITRQPVQEVELAWYKTRTMQGQTQVAQRARNESGVTLRDVYNHTREPRLLGLTLCTIVIPYHLAVPQAMLEMLNQKRCYKPFTLSPVDDASGLPQPIMKVLIRLSNLELIPLRLVNQAFCTMVDRIMTTRENLDIADAKKGIEKAFALPNRPKHNTHFVFEIQGQLLGSVPSNCEISAAHYYAVRRTVSKLNETIFRLVSTPLAETTKIAFKFNAFDTSVTAGNAHVCKPPTYSAGLQYTDDAGKVVSKRVHVHDGIRTKDLVAVMSTTPRVHSDIRLLDVMLPGNDHWAWKKSLALNAKPIGAIVGEVEGS